MKKTKNAQPPKSLRNLARQILIGIGEDPEREGLVKTPERVERSLQYLTSGYQKSARDVLNKAVFHEPYDEMVIMREIELYSLCEHHLLPFYGKCHVGY